MKQREKKTSLPSKNQVEAERKRYRKQKAYGKAFRGTIYVLTVVAAVAVLVATLVLPVLQIEGSSMEPTLSNGDIVITTKTSRFERGDLCAFTWNNKLLVKRVIGVPGDWIEMDKDGRIYLNGEKIEEPYVKQHALGECDLEFPLQVPAGHYFVIGDMRENSIDSRNSLVGCVSQEQIVGKCFFRIWPIKKLQIF
ncbi:MAG: signal peptidase I [Agathobacter sp.]|nr:signal peptidase I [Agathobacter sp.]